MDDVEMGAWNGDEGAGVNGEQTTTLLQSQGPRSAT